MGAKISVANFNRSSWRKRYDDAFVLFRNNWSVKWLNLTFITIISIWSLWSRLKPQFLIMWELWKDGQRSGVFNQFRYLKQKPYWGNYFWAGGYCADSIGLDEEEIRKYVKYQEKKEREAE